MCYYKTWLQMLMFYARAVDVRCGMKYRKDKYGKDLSQLGYGCMRFTKKGNSIDYAKAEKEVMLAV